jgi:hypothetical protein
MGDMVGDDNAFAGFWNAVYGGVATTPIIDPTPGLSVGVGQYEGWFDGHDGLRHDINEVDLCVVLAVPNVTQEIVDAYTKSRVANDNGGADLEARLNLTRTIAEQTIFTGKSTRHYINLRFLEMVDKFFTQNGIGFDIDASLLHDGGVFGLSRQNLAFNTVSGSYRPAYGFARGGVQSNQFGPVTNDLAY